jgi:thiamine-phosphate pyrophosphorylase
MSSKHKQKPRPKQAEPRPQPRLYLMTPRLGDADAFASLLERVLTAGDVAAVLIRLVLADERTMIARAHSVAAVAQRHAAAALIDGRSDLVARAGCDGVHAAFGEFAEALEQMKPDRIVGAGGLTLRDDAMTAAERGADYVMFGEPTEDGARPRFESILDRVAWWAEVFEAPCVGYAGDAGEVAPLVEAGADFVALGDWVWTGDAETIVAVAARDLKLPETAT